MLDLKNTQEQFQNFLLAKKSSIKNEIVVTENVSAETRLAIYRDGYYLRFLEVLEKDYVILHAVIGCEKFAELGRHYVDYFPSTFRSIRWYGKEFASFLQKSGQPAEWVELANFEWLLMESFDEAGSRSVTVEQMTAIYPEKWPDLRFVLHPAVRRLKLFWNIVDVLTAYRQGEKLPKIKKNKIATNWIIWRKEYQMQFCPLSLDEAYMIDAIQAGKKFSVICEELCEWIAEDKVAMHAALLLKRFISDGIISKIV